VKLVRLSLIIGLLLGAAAVAAVAGPTVASPGSVARHHVYNRPSGKHVHIDCAWSAGMCAEVASQISEQAFGHYVGHDEPSVLFNSHATGAGNRMQYNLTLPKDPPGTHANQPGKSFAFQLSGAEWLGMVICDTQSYPEQVRFCPPDSDRNILDPSVSAKHVGQAYMEMQFYPPGWVPWPTWRVAVGASSCSPTQWCAALNIDSLALNAVTGKTLNNTCLKKVGEEYLNFAFVTKNGKSTGPANPLHSTQATFSPSKRDLFMNSGDHLRVRIHDTPHGVQVQIKDLTTGGSGLMTASKANGFGQIKFAPTGSSCKEIPYNFHPMYKTSTRQTRVTWAAAPYNVAFDTEIGHFQFCRGPAKIPATQFGLLPNGNPTTCPKANREGMNRHPDADDIFCFPASRALRYKIPGCTFTNFGFDGQSYQKVWPDGNTLMHPTPFQFSSPTTGPNYNKQYSQVALNTDLPNIEFFTCHTGTGKGCTRIPPTDQGKPAAFYPFYSTTNTAGGCVWQFGNNIPGETNNYGASKQYGPLLGQSYTKVHGGGRSHVLFNDFEKFLNGNPCPQK
jgi:hypothetical protein